MLAYRSGNATVRLGMFPSGSTLLLPELLYRAADAGIDVRASHFDVAYGDAPPGLTVYDIVVTLPEGVTQSLRLDDLIPNGLQLDTSFGSSGYQLITTVAGSAALTADFAGSVTVS